MGDGILPQKKYQRVLLIIIGIALVGIGAYYVWSAPSTYYNLIIEGNQSTQPNQEELIRFSELTEEEKERIDSALDYGVTSFGPNKIEKFESKQYIEHEGVYYRYTVSRYYEYRIVRAVFGGVIALAGILVSLIATLKMR
jgi:hypothetical protein